METTSTIIELTDNDGGPLALDALAQHLDAMEQDGTEPSGEYIHAVTISAGGVARIIHWPIPMPRREEHIVLGEG